MALILALCQDGHPYLVKFNESLADKRLILRQSRFHITPILCIDRSRYRYD